MKEENIVCKNEKCSYNKGGHCTKFTSKHLLNKMSCEERKR